MTSDNKIKVLVVDDTVIYRKILKDVLSEIDSTEVIGTAPNGDIAIRKIELDPPDLILLDVEMPIKDGLQTLEEVKKKYPEIGVIMVSGVNERQAAITMEALNKGALDFIPKPLGNNLQANIQSLKQSLIPIISIFTTRKNLSSFKTDKPKPVQESITAQKPKTIIQKPLTEAPVFKPLTTGNFPSKIDVMVVGISTGGPNALAKFIPLLPENIDVPILIVQHMPPMFTKSLANHLNSKSKLEVLEANDKDILQKNKVFIAPGGKHMVVNKESDALKINIIDTAPVNSCKPSVDVLFDSVSKTYNGNVLSVIMTGMGSDGLNGIKSLKKISNYTLTQSEDSCVVYGMPRSVDEAGLSNESVNLDNLADRVVNIIKNGIKK